MHIFLDTDVILDYLTDRKPFSDSAEQVFALIESRKISASVSSLSFSNLYFLLKRELGKAKALNILKDLSFLLSILKVDEDIILKALECDFPDFEDAIQYQSASESKNVDIIVTRNISDYRKSELSVMTPEAALNAYWLSVKA